MSEDKCWHCESTNHDTADHPHEPRPEVPVMKVPNYMHTDEAKANGFIIDWHAAGRPIAYKGSRGSPTEWHDCFTELESRLIRRVASPKF